MDVLPAAQLQATSSTQKTKQKKRASRTNSKKKDTSPTNAVGRLPPAELGSPTGVVGSKIRSTKANAKTTSNAMPPAELGSPSNERIEELFPKFENHYFVRFGYDWDEAYKIWKSKDKHPFFVMLMVLEEEWPYDHFITGTKIFKLNLPEPQEAEASYVLEKYKEHRANSLTRAQMKMYLGFFEHFIEFLKEPSDNKKQMETLRETLLATYNEQMENIRKNNLSAEVERQKSFDEIP